MIYYNKNGEENTIVLLHGFCENNTCFNQQVFFLQQYFCVITPDLPGFGNSEAIDNTSIEGMADEVFQILSKEKISSCVMLGHSMGGYVTLAFAKKYPHLLKGFGLIHSTAFGDNDERKIKRDQAIHVIEEKGSDFYVENFIRQLFSSSFHDKKIIDEMVNEGKRTSIKGLSEAIKAMKSRPDSVSFLKETNLPVLFIAGKNDSIIPENAIFYQASLCKQSEIIYLKKSAHMGFIEESDKCTKSIYNFMLALKL